MSPAPETALLIDSSHEAIVRGLLDPSAYPDRPSKVRLVETHISQVFLTNDFVYKLKKPVRFDFLDFSTLEKRERACREEVRLNRRMTHDIYLTVLSVTQQPSGRVTLGGRGPVVDWVVQMRRLRDERMLDELIRTGGLTDGDIRRLVDFLARYYADIQPVIVRPDEFHDSLITHVTGNFESLMAATWCDREQVRRVHTAQLRLLLSRPEVFLARALDGRVIDGHGDLRPEHICLTNPPAVFDCVEFSADLRCLDVLDELCFLAMECDFLEGGSIGERTIEAYLAQSGDRPPPEIVAFYKSYRACVRAKVAAIRSDQVPGSSRDDQRVLCSRYLALAERYTSSAGTRPLLIVVTGLMGTGKSTLARRLGEELGVDVLRTDEIRQTLFPIDGRSDPFGEGRYQAKSRARVYEEILSQAADRLTAGISVILDGTFTQTAYREMAVRMGRKLSADVLVVDCVCPRDIAVDRIRLRLNRNEADPSEARPELYDAQAMERSRDGDSWIDIRIDTTEPLAAQAMQVLTTLPAPYAGPIHLV